MKRTRMIPPLLLVVMLLAGLAGAQTFNADRYLEQCLKLEAGGDLTSARESCHNALELQPGNNEARLALGRLELRLGNLGTAEDLLLPLRSRDLGPEVNLLLAEAALERGDAAMADSLLAGNSVRSGDASADLRARHAWLAGRTLEQEGRLQLALGEYRNAMNLEPAVSTYHRAAAAVLLELGLPDAAADELLAWRSASGTAGDAALHAELARALWAAGELRSAAAEFEGALQLGRDGPADVRAANLRSLAAVRLGLGDVQGATAALSDAFRHGNLTWLLGGNRLHWVLLLFAVLGVLLWAEGRTTPPTPAPHQKQPPAPGPILLVLAAALLVSIAAALLYGNLVLSNSAALFTPVQGDTVKAVYVAVLGLTLALFSLPLLKGTDAGAAAAEQPVLHGFGLGLLLIVLTVAFLNWLPAALAAPWQLNLSRISVYTVAAVLLLPFAETYFRALLLPVFGTRYGSSPAVFISAGLYALVLGTPVILSLLLGAVLAWTFSTRVPNAGFAITAQLVLQAGMLVLHMLWPGLSLLLP